VEWFALESPIGPLGVAVTGDAVSRLSFRGSWSRTGGSVAPAAGQGALTEEVAGEPTAEPDPVRRTRYQLEEYFAGARTQFDLPLVVVRGSDFERAVWAEIAAIPYGETVNYGAIARAVGEPGGAQAVGLACNRNPHPVVVACHRVIGANGKLVGFGGGLDRKRFLLELEARVHIEHMFA
jgi:methylated-DNA-[protein]-cysteine S-methyltransferase